MNIKDLRIPCEPPCTEPYARWCGSRGRATAPSYPIFWSQKNPISGWELATRRLKIWGRPFRRALPYPNKFSRALSRSSKKKRYPAWRILSDLTLGPPRRLRFSAWEPGPSSGRGGAEPWPGLLRIPRF
jgi:hypothetical protein